MAIARKYLVDKDSRGFYHCISRCVRRAYLCGNDPISGRNCDHRKAWLEKRLLELANIFSVDIYAYAIMDNHYHLVLQLDPKGTRALSDEAVAERWLKAYPGRFDKPEMAQQRQLKKLAIMADKAKLTLYRQRLACLSWFMARLNEPLAKRSNREDCVKGRFWESRFESIALLDESAVLSCMAYVDLNPIRAGLVQDLAQSFFTSVRRRIAQLQACEPSLCLKLSPLNAENKVTLTLMSQADYLRLVEWTGRAIVYPDKARLPANIGSILTRLNLQQANWLDQIQHLGQASSIAFGSVNKLKAKAKQLKQAWIKGISRARMMYQP